MKLTQNTKNNRLGILALSVFSAGTISAQTYLLDTSSGSPTNLGTNGGTIEYTYNLDSGPAVNGQNSFTIAYTWSALTGFGPSAKTWTTTPSIDSGVVGYKLGADRYASNAMSVNNASGESGTAGLTAAGFNAQEAQFQSWLSNNNLDRSGTYTISSASLNPSFYTGYSIVSENVAHINATFLGESSTAGFYDNGQYSWVEGSNTGVSHGTTRQMNYLVFDNGFGSFDTNFAPSYIGQSSYTFQANPVPEPSSALLIGLAGITTLLRRNRR